MMDPVFIRVRGCGCDCGRKEGAGGVQVSLFAGGMMVGILENPKT